MTKSWILGMAGSLLLAGAALAKDDVPDGGTIVIPITQQYPKDPVTPTNPLPGGNGGGGIGTLPPDGGPGGTPGSGTAPTAPPCATAACKKKACLAASLKKHGECITQANKDRDFCMTRYAPETAIAMCKGSGGAAAGVDHRLRSPIIGPIIETCDLTPAVPVLNIPSVWVCKKAIGAFGYAEYYDPMLGLAPNGNNQSAWMQGGCDTNGYSTAGCLRSWMDGTKGCSATSSSESPTGLNWESGVNLPGFTGSVGGGQGKDSEDFNVVFDPQTGLVEGCSMARIESGKQCNAEKSGDDAKCAAIK